MTYVRFVGRFDHDLHHWTIYEKGAGPNGTDTVIADRVPHHWIESMVEWMNSLDLVPQPILRLMAERKECE